MQAGYAIFNIEVTNPEDYKEYVEKVKPIAEKFGGDYIICLLYTSPSPRDRTRSRMPSSA